MTESQPGPSKLHIVLLAIIFAVGIFLRVTPHAFSAGATLQSIAFLHPEPAFNKIGFDEGLYAEYVNKLDKLGLSAYPLIVKDYVERQERLHRSILSPLRFLYIFTAYVWHSIF